MTDNRFDSRVFQAFLDMGGPEMRAELLMQVQSDLARCLDLLRRMTDTAENAGDRAELRKTAHEIKGIAATIGAIELAACALNTETACARQDMAELDTALSRLVHSTQATMATITDLTQAA